MTKFQFLTSSLGLAVAEEGLASTGMGMVVEAKSASPGSVVAGSIGAGLEIAEESIATGSTRGVLVGASA